MKYVKNGMHRSRNLHKTNNVDYACKQRQQTDSFVKKSKSRLLNRKVKHIIPKY